MTNIRLSCKNQYREFLSSIAAEKLRKYRGFDELFDNVRGHISFAGLDFVRFQLSRTRPLEVCTHSFTRVYGIPCAHLLDEKISQGVKLTMDDFSKQWWIEDEFHEEEISLEHEFERIKSLAESGRNAANSVLPELRLIGNNDNVANPSIPRTKGRPKGANNRNRAERDPSGFEYVEAASDQAEFDRKCVALCSNLQIYLRSHSFTDIQRKSQAEGVTLIGFNQGMCSLMKKGKSCVKNSGTVEWLSNFLNPLSE